MTSRTSKIQRLLLSLIALSLQGCKPVIRAPGEGSSVWSLLGVISPSSSAYTAANWSSQPVYGAYLNGALKANYSGSASLSAYTDSACTASASGALATTQNPLSFLLGLASFTGVNYTLPGHLEETLYLKAQSSGLGASSCSSAIDIVHHFNAGSGYALFQHLGNSAGGANNASKNEEVVAKHVLMDSQGRLVIAGVTTGSLGERYGVIYRYYPDGSLDTTFGSSGYTLFDSSGVGADSPVALQKDSLGRYLVVSNSAAASTAHNEVAIWRFTSNGAVDTAFGGGSGYVIFQHNGLGASGLNNGTKSDLATDFIIDSQGRYVLIGSSFNAMGGSDLVMWRYTSAGALDASFGSGTGYMVLNSGVMGTAGAPANNKLDEASSIAVDGQDRYIVVGSSRDVGGRMRLVLWRFNEDASLDTTLSGGDGYVIFQPAGNTAAGSAVSSDYGSVIKIDSQGRYLIAGRSAAPNLELEVTLWRYNSSGAIDTTYGSGTGYITLNHLGANFGGVAYGGGRDDTLSDIALDSSGNAVILAYTNNASAGSYEMVLARYDSSGTLDTTFGSGAGSVLFQHDGVGAAGAANISKYDAPSSLVIDSRGRIIAAGTSYTPASTPEVVLWRYLSSGDLDL